MNEHGRKRTTVIVVAALALTATAHAASAAGTARILSSHAHVTSAPAANGTVDAAAAAPARSAAAVTLFVAGTGTTYQTTAATVGEFLAEHGIVPTSADAVSVPLSRPVTGGMDVEYRPAVRVTIADGRIVRTVRSSSATIGDLLASANARLGASDSVEPSLVTPLVAGETVRIRRVVSWETHRFTTVAPRTENRSSTTLAIGLVRTLNPGHSGLGEISTRFERVDGVTRRLSTVHRTLRVAQDRVVLHGTGHLAALARIATTGFEAATKLAGGAISMIATAYTAACYGCSGLTASGARAGHGVVAVDPAIIPLGTRLFIPGYGRAVAGDTGGAIVGHRIDLGFDSNSDALRFGRRAITVYVLRK